MVSLLTLPSTDQSIYQSSGKCSSYCSAFAFGILQGKLCWCSNYAPDVSTSSSACSDPCPGYPSDTCGSASGGLYEYLSLNALPSGTEGSGSSVAAQTTNVQVSCLRFSQCRHLMASVKTTIQARTSAAALHACLFDIFGICR